MKKYMKSATLLLLNFLFITLISCDNNDLNEQYSLPQGETLINLSPQEYASIAFDNPRELTEIEAINLAEDFVKSNEGVEVEKSGTKSLDKNILLKVKTKYYLDNSAPNSTLTKSSTKGDAKINIPIYELSLTRGSKKGLVIVSGDERVQKVIAYIPSTDETIRKNTSNAQYLEEVAIRSLLNNVAEIDQLKDSLRIQVLGRIAQKMGISRTDVYFDKIKKYLSVNDELLSKFKPIQTPPSQVLSAVMPMCLTSWDQTAPFNCQLPVGNIEGYLNPTNYYAGCGVIAAAQIIAFLEPPLTVYNTTINWNYLKQKPYIYTFDPSDKKNMVGFLIKDTYAKTGAYPVYNSSGYISGVATSESSIENCIRVYANCSPRQNWNSDVVRNSILANRPVVAAGTGTRSDGSTTAHAFIVDGYLLCKQYYGAMPASINTGTKELVKLYDLYFHANLGWGGTSNGYYLINKDTSVDFETTGSTYKSGSLRIIPNIVKK